MSERIAVVGYGNQGRAHALNLRDAGHDVCVGARASRASERQAREDGFDVVPPASAAAGADVLALLVPDEVLSEVGAELAPRMRPGGALVLAHGSALAFGALAPPDGLDVLLVAPSGPGTELRRAVAAGDRLPAVLAVHRDASGRARERTLAYAEGIGCDLDRSTWASVEEEAVVDLFGEQAVLCGGLAELVGRAFDTLCEAGYPPELAHLECVEQLRLTTALISEHGLDGMWSRISATARYGGLETGPRVVGEASGEAMREALERIRSGSFFRDFLADHASGGAHLRAMAAAARRERLEATGEARRRSRAARRESGDTSEK